PADAWKNAVRGRFYRPLKEAVSLRLDADVLAWLKKDGQGYQTRVNQMLRERMLKDLEGR
ncbi:MAG TPA: BrnA antitoxin family protein, partial [Acidobacteriaceae bacterium]